MDLMARYRIASGHKRPALCHMEHPLSRKYTVLQELVKRPGPNPHAEMDKMPLPDPSRAEQMIADLVAQDPEPPLVINRAGTDSAADILFQAEAL